MHYKLKCFESRGETLCDSSPVPPSERNPVNTIYCILHIPSPPCAVCVNVLVSPQLPEPGLPPGAGCCGTCFPAGWAPTASSLGRGDAGNAGQGLGESLDPGQGQSSFPSRASQYSPSLPPGRLCPWQKWKRSWERMEGLMLSILSILVLS